MNRERAACDKTMDKASFDAVRKRNSILTACMIGRRKEMHSRRENFQYQRPALRCGKHVLETYIADNVLSANKIKTCCFGIACRDLHSHTTHPTTKGEDNETRLIARFAGDGCSGLAVGRTGACAAAIH